MGSSELVTQLRRRLADERYEVPAFSIRSLDSFASEVMLDVRDGYLRTDVVNGKTRDLNVSLTTVGTDTLGGLADFLSASFVGQYRVETADGMQHGHPSLDLQPVTAFDIKSASVMLRTRRFSNEELLRFLRTAVQRHNPSYTLENTSPSEYALVLQLAHVESLRNLATDASKRRGLSETVSDLLELASNIESAYQADYKRIAKALVPVRTDDDGVREGDVVVGHFARLSLRNGAQATAAANLQPQAPKLYDFADGDVYDYALVARWRRSRETDIHMLELWRDTQINVKRTRNVDLFPTTSKMVWQSRTNGAANDPESWGTKDLNGELVAAHMDGFMVPNANLPIPGSPNALEPETTYYYRLYLVDRNGEWVASDVVSARTRKGRALFSRDAGVPALSVATGPRAGGTAITIRGTGFTANSPTVTIGGKAVASLVIVNDTTITCVSPATNAWAPADQDVVLSSASYLRDVFPTAWSYSG